MGTATNRTYKHGQSQIKLYVDGTFGPDRNVIGYTALMVCDGEIIGQFTGSEEVSSNDRLKAHMSIYAELAALEAGLRMLGDFARCCGERIAHCKAIQIVSDCNQAIKAANGGQISTNILIRNTSRRIIDLLRPFKVHAKKVSGHVEQDTMNDMCDGQAYKAMSTHKIGNGAVMRVTLLWREGYVRKRIVCAGHAYTRNNGRVCDGRVMPARNCPYTRTGWRI